ncbi:hypothetical protein [Paenibacillus sp. R14(2021)]|uniref:hypothetical protein n=1 Tax=Paenibacillus sp. R14(2021) TaxID=2859228 RepID=UPI001C611D36|nr:hypothetical protein [Paenibacillus sp. R14(2021)]
MLKIIRVVIILLLIAILFELVFHLVHVFDDHKADLNFYSKLSAVSTAVAAVGGLVLLIITYLTLREARKQRESIEEPAVTIRLLPDRKNSNFLYFVLKNTGGGPAYDINVMFTPDLPYGEGTLNTLGMFKRMPILEKGEEVLFFFDTAPDYFNSAKPKLVEATITYFRFLRESRSNKQIKRKFEINFEERKGQRQIINKDMTDLVKEIEELKHALLISTFERGERND